MKPASRAVKWNNQRLGTDYIDLMQTHWQDGTTPIAETMGCLMDMKREGKSGPSAAPTLPSPRWKLTTPPDSSTWDQELYSMFDRKHEPGNLKYCAENKVSFLAYSPLSQGLLTGKIGPERTFGPGDQRNTKPRFSVENRKRIADMLATFAPLTENTSALSASSSSAGPWLSPAAHMLWLAHVTPLR